MSNKKSRFLLQTMIGMSLLVSVNLCCMDELNRLKDVCINEYNRLEPICIEGLMKAAIYCDDSIESVDAEKVFLGLGAIAVGAGIKDSCHIGSKISSNPLIIGSVVAIRAAILSSLVCGIYNIREQDAMLQSIEIKYGLIPAYDWYQLPGHYATQLICYGSDVQTVEQVPPFIQMLKSKVEKMTDATIFDFTAFIDQFPHTGVNNSYCIAKKYFDGGQCVTLSDLQSTVDNSITMIEADFKELMKLTELSNAFKLPVTLNDFNNMQLFLNQYEQHIIINSYLGAFGYSPLQNGQRVKNSILEIVRYRAFLLNLKEVLATCSDSKDTQLKDAQGNLSFTLQHVHHVQDVQIK